MIPPYVGDKRNFTLTLEELEKYHTVLEEMKKAVEMERVRVHRNYIAVRDGRIVVMDDAPRCTGFTHVMEFMVRLARSKLALTQFMVDVTGQRVKEKRDGAGLVEAHPQSDQALRRHA